MASEDKKTAQSYKEFWEGIGDTYENAIAMMDGSPDDRVLNLTGRYMADKIAQALLVDERDRVFELGCGVGRIGRFVSQRCNQWQGFDISSKMIDHARTRMRTFENVRFQALERTEFTGVPGECFDKGYSHAVFIHMDKEDLYLYLKEAFRILRPGGLFYFDTWNLQNEVGWERWLWEVESWAQSDQKGRKHVSRNQFCVPQEVKIYIEKAGFAEVFCLGESFWIQSLMLKPDGSWARDRVESIREQIGPHFNKIAVPPTLNLLFKHHLNLAKGQMAPREFYDLLEQMPVDEEVLLYRNWLRLIWEYKSNEWGPYPGERLG